MKCWEDGNDGSCIPFCGHLLGAGKTEVIARVTGTGSWPEGPCALIWLAPEIFGKGSLGIGEFESLTAVEAVSTLLEFADDTNGGILLAGCSGWLSSRLRFLPHNLRGSDSGRGNDTGEAIAELNNGGID